MSPSLSSLASTSGTPAGPVDDRLFAVLYAELHRIAKRELAQRGAQLTLGATTLLHEAYLAMCSRNASEFPDRARFMGYAARVMRGVIIDYVRSRRAIKRGGQFEITSLGADAEQIAELVPDHRELTRISEALDELSAVDPDLAELVDLRFFCGFSFAEIAAMRGTSERTIQRHWDRARVYLHRSLHQARTI